MAMMWRPAHDVQNMPRRKTGGGWLGKRADRRHQRENDADDSGGHSAHPLRLA